MGRMRTCCLALVLVAGARVLCAQGDGSVATGLLGALHSSPDRILFESYVDDNWEIFEIRADGAGRRNLTNSRDVHELYPQASPDGRRICFLVDVQRDGETARSVYYMNADGTLVIGEGMGGVSYPNGNGGAETFVLKGGEMVGPNDKPPHPAPGQYLRDIVEALRDAATHGIGQDLRPFVPPVDFFVSPALPGR